MPRSITNSALILQRLVALLTGHSAKCLVVWLDLDRPALLDCLIAHRTVNIVKLRDSQAAESRNSHACVAASIATSTV